MARVELRDIRRPDDRAAVMGLRRGPGQERYLNSMAEIFAEADDEQRAMPHPWAVHDAATGALVGFAMISDNIPQPVDDDLVGPYFLWKLLIDAPVQGRGYGAATLDAIVDYLRTRPGADVLYTSCRGRFRVAARVLPALRLHRYRPSHVGRKRPRVHRRSQQNHARISPRRSCQARRHDRSRLGQHPAPNSVELPATRLNCC